MGCTGTQESPPLSSPLTGRSGGRGSGWNHEPGTCSWQQSPGKPPAQCSEPFMHTALGDQNPGAASSLLSRGHQGGLFPALGLRLPMSKADSSV